MVAMVGPPHGIQVPARCHPYTPSAYWLLGPRGRGECLGQAKGVLQEEDRETSGEG